MSWRVRRTLFSCLLLVGAPLTGAAIGPSCTVPTVDFADKKCQTVSDCPGKTCSAAGKCVSAADAGGDGSSPVGLCQAIPPFGSGVQTVDGNNDDFASVPSQYLSYKQFVNSANIMNDELDVTAQVGWSDAGLHMFFHVQYESGGPVALPPFDGGELWYGDALELFLKGSLPLTGNFNGVSDRGAIQIAVAPDLTNPPRSETYVDKGNTLLGPLSSDTVGAHRDGSDAYDIELMIPWRLILAPGATEPKAGSKIGFDFAVDYRYRGDGGALNPANPELQMLLADNPAVGTAPTDCPPGSTSVPSCDDRTWCTPTLSP
jgi:hypothetical protein